MTNKPQKHKSLSNVLPRGQLVNRAWLNKRGFTRPDIDYYLRAEHLSAPVRGFYLRPGLALKWQAIAYSLQEMHYSLHVGGLTALNEQGFAHNIPMSEQTIQLYSASELPYWLDDWHSNNNTTFRLKPVKQLWLKDLPKSLLTHVNFSQWDWSIDLAQPELAIVEHLVSIHSEEDFKQVDLIFENLATLSPQRLQATLEHCTHIKAKRLFGWFASRHAHAWENKIDWQSIHLGSGKRQIVKGHYDKQWQITVPSDMTNNKEEENGSKQPLF
jgi:hypothetical protein